MRTTREIRAAVRARLEAEAERQAKENADARRRARADYEEAKGSRRRTRMEGARAAWMAAERRPTEAVEVVAGWTLQDVHRAAGVVPEGEVDVARSVAAVFWNEARARVALRGLFDAVQGAVFSERLYGGEGNLRELTKETLEAMASEERDKILWEEIRNVILSTVRRVDARTKKTDDAVLMIANGKQQQAIASRRNLEEMGLTRKDPDLQKVLRDIDAELKTQKKQNVAAAIRAVLSRPGCPRSLEDEESVRRAYYRLKARKKRIATS